MPDVWVMGKSGKSETSRGGLDEGSVMANELNGKTIAFLMANEGVEQVELTRPMQACMDAGAKVRLLAPEVGKIQAFNHLDKGDVFESDGSTAEARVADFTGVVIPGGVANPDALRMDTAAVSFVKEAWQAGLPIASICHGPWVLVEAGIVDDLKVTSWPSLRTDIRNAGGEWVDEECVCDKGVVTSRNPDDLDAFCDKIIEEFAEGNHASRRS